MRKNFFKLLLVGFATILMLQSCKKEEEPEVQCKNCDCTATTVRNEFWTNEDDASDTKTVTETEEDRMKNTRCSGMYKNTPYNETLEYWESNPVQYFEGTTSETEQDTTVSPPETLFYDVEYTEETTYNCTCS